MVCCQIEIGGFMSYKITFCLRHGLEVEGSALKAYWMKDGVQSYDLVPFETIKAMSWDQLKSWLGY
jgi:hypothetical protein